ncbi:MAG TPA: right-handed parallel beta-helix repeat-containing protein [Planctomycetaceae bacterium]|nr:right-handed parallel beta-helix repeat-containing protein [Planctomycetaceae bacterium]
MRPTILLACAVLALSLLGPPATSADDRAGVDRDFTAGADEDYEYWESRRRERSSGEAPRPAASEARDAHLNVQAGHLAFETFGRAHSITPVELFPYLRMHDDLFFGDARLFVTNTGELGGNAGLGYRLRSDGGEVYGVSLWYDADDSTGELFHQAGLSLELLAAEWEARANGYVPVGDRSRDFSVGMLNQRFVGNSIVFDRDRRWGEALPGLDLELGVRLPGQFGRDHDVRVFGGWYYFLGDEADDINGFKARVQGDLLAGLSTQVEFTTDGTFGTNVMLGVSWAYDEKFRTRREGSGRPDRLTEFVRRNYNIIVSRQRALTPGVVAVNAGTGQPFVVQHISSGGGGPLLSEPPGGTVDAPFATLADAQAAGGDLIFVHAGSVINESVVLQSGNRLIGEGGEFAINVAGFGNVLLPRATAGASRPVIQSTSGDSVVLASNSVFSGFVIDGSAGHGLIGAGVSDVFVSHVDVRNVAGAGILLQNTAGPVTFERVQIDNAAGPGLHVAGGNGSVSFDGTIDNQAGYALLVENTTGGAVDLGGAAIHDDGGQGVLIDQAAGSVVVGSVLVENATATGIEVRDSPGNVAFGSASVASSGAVAAVSVTDNAGSTSFGVLNVASTGGPALQVLDGGRIVIGAGTLSATGGSAVILRDTQMDVELTSVSSDGADYGLEIVDAPGTFVVFGNNALGTGGTIQNATVAGVLLQNAGSVGLQDLDLTNNAVGIDATSVDWLAVSRVRVSGSAGYGLDARNSRRVEIAGSLFDGNGAASDSSIRLVADALTDSLFVLATSTVVSGSGDAIRLVTESGGEGSTLQAAFLDNAISTAGTGGSGVHATWDGAFALSLTGNAFTGTAGSNTGVLVNLPSATKSSTVGVANNSFNFAGSNSTAIDVTADAPTAVVVARNAIGFAGTSGTGLAFTLGNGAGVTLTSNAIGDAAGGATGILFRSMSGESDVSINDNLVNLLSTGVLVDRGIIFDSITGTVHLSGTQNNRVNFATQAFSAPAGATDGQILVNGVAVP